MDLYLVYLRALISLTIFCFMMIVSVSTAKTIFEKNNLKFMRIVWWIWNFLTGALPVAIFMDVFAR